jgi:ribosomal-protein-alanine N-acetyltransferase
LAAFAAGEESLIQTDRLILRPFLPADSADAFEYLSDPATYIFEPGKPLTSPETAALIAERSAGMDFLAVILKSESKLIGHLYFHQLEPAEGMTWELGYIFHPRYQKKGYASEAASALVDHAFAAFGTHRIMARCDPENTASWKMLERIGFVREGFFRKAGFVHKDTRGKPIWINVYEYSKLNPGGK